MIVSYSSSSGILLRCLSGDEAMEVMHQSHAGTLAEHQEGRKLLKYLLQSDKKGKSRQKSKALPGY